MLAVFRPEVGGANQGAVARILVIDDGDLAVALLRALFVARGHQDPTSPPLAP